MVVRCLARGHRLISRQLFHRLQKVLDRQSCFCDQAAERAASHLWMVRHRKRRYMPGFRQDDVAPAPSTRSDTPS